MSKKHLYTGKSGQLAVMAEFVSRGYNVAVPEVDIGDDIFVVRDRDGELSRVQVKTANGKETQGGFSAMFKLSRRQLETPHTPDMNYVFVIRYRDSWRDFMVISREALYDLHAVHAIGTELEGNVLLSFVFSEEDVLCKEQSLKAYRNRWSKWPVIDHDARPRRGPPDAAPDIVE
jgi:hypothetical protein